MITTHGYKLVIELSRFVETNHIASDPTLVNSTSRCRNRQEVGFLLFVVCCMLQKYLSIGCSMCVAPAMMDDIQEPVEKC